MTITTKIFCKECKNVTGQSVEKLITRNEWIKVALTDDCPGLPILLSDEYGNVYLGHTSFDFYDAKFWFPIPVYPYGNMVTTNDECVTRLLKPET